MKDLSNSGLPLCIDNRGQVSLTGNPVRSIQGWEVSDGVDTTLVYGCKTPEQAVISVILPHNDFWMGKPGFQQNPKLNRKACLDLLIADGYERHEAPMEHGKERQVVFKKDGYTMTATRFSEYF